MLQVAQKQLTLSADTYIPCSSASVGRNSPAFPALEVGAYLDSLSRISTGS